MEKLHLGEDSRGEQARRAQNLFPLLLVQTDGEFGVPLGKLSCSQEFFPEEL